MTSDKLVFRLNRAVGQVESIKKKIENKVPGYFANLR